MRITQPRQSEDRPNMDPFVDITPNEQSAAEQASPNGSVDPFTAIMQGGGDGEILKQPTEITQDFGTYNPIEPTANHRAGDTNFAANEGSPVYLPPGQWQVVKSYSNANPQGAPGDYQDNSGWGNDVWVKDAQTGHMLHFLHLASVNTQDGQTLEEGGLVGTTGSSGNATGPNLGVEYYDEKGQLGDIMKSPYSQYLPVKKSQ